MARNKGSEDLFDLIHRLTKEEKGYFKKYATRHTSAGNVNLKLFEAISKQPVFEERSLKTKFKAYPVIKVQLKEMITDSLLLYYRAQHPHINLLSQVQKVQVLLIKGLQAEALKVLDKAVAKAGKMEAFGITSYLLRLGLNIRKKAILSIPEITAMTTAYVNAMGEQQQLEANMFLLESTGLNATGKTRGVDVFNAPSKATDIEAVKQLPVLSERGNILRLQTLFSLYRSELNEREMLPSIQANMKAIENFKKNNDPSFDDVATINNYLVTLGTYGKFKEKNAVCDKGLQETRINQTEHYELIVRYIIHKSGVLIHWGNFAEAVNFINTHEKAFLEATAFIDDNIKLEVFMQHKVVALFLNKQYAEAWITMQQVYPKVAFKIINVDLADWRMLEMMTQFMMGNFELIKGMSTKYQRELSKNKIVSLTYKTLLHFFSKATPINYKNEALRASETLQKYYADNKKFPRKAFALIRYTYWLNEIGGSTTMQHAMQKQFAE